MWVYHAITVILFCLAWHFRRRADWRVCYSIAVGSLILFAGFRFSVGCDFWGYKIHYDMQNPELLFENIGTYEPLYWMLVDCINFLGLPYEALNLVTALVFFWGLSTFLMRFPNPIAGLAFSFPMTIFALLMTATRQALAMGVLLYALTELMRRRHFRYFMLVGIASQFHASAIVFLLLSPFVFFKTVSRSFICSVPFLISCVFLLPSYQGYDVAVGRYMEMDNDAAGAVYRVALLFFFGFFFQWWLRPRWAAELQESFRLVNVISIIMIVSLPAAFVLPTIVDRLGYYWFAIAAVMAAALPSLALPQRDMMYLLIMAGWTIFFVVWSNLSLQLPLCYAPYRSWMLGFPQQIDPVF